MASILLKIHEFKNMILTQLDSNLHAMKVISFIFALMRLELSEAGFNNNHVNTPRQPLLPRQLSDGPRWRLRSLPHQSVCQPRAGLSGGGGPLPGLSARLPSRCVRGQPPLGRPDLGTLLWRGHVD